MISGIILAAGASKRMGVPKQTLDLGGRPVIEHPLETFLASRLDEVILVVKPGLGWRSPRDERLHIVLNRRYLDGISASVRAGIDAVGARSEAVVIGLGDKPLVKTSTIEKLIDKFEESDSEIVVPVFHGKRGNPVLFSRSVFPELRTLRGDVGAKAVITGGTHSVAEVEVDDAGVVLDLDTEADLKRAKALHARRLRSASE